MPAENRSTIIPPPPSQLFAPNAGATRRSATRHSVTALRSQLTVTRPSSGLRETRRRRRGLGVHPVGQHLSEQQKLTAPTTVLGVRSATARSATASRSCPAACPRDCPDRCGSGAPTTTEPSAQRGCSPSRAAPGGAAEADRADDRARELSPALASSAIASLLPRTWPLGLQPRRSAVRSTTAAAARRGCST